MKIWVDIARKLSHDYGWDLCYWTGNPKLEALVNKEFPEAIFHNQIFSIKGISPPCLNDIKGSLLDQNILDSLCCVESTILKMMDRLDAGNTFTYQERIEHYHRLVSYWLGILDRYQPDLIFFPTLPHMVYDFIIYKLCQLKGIKTLMFEITSLPGIIFPWSDYLQGCAPIISIYRQRLSESNWRNFELSEEVHHYLKKVKGDYVKGMPFYLRLYKDKKTSHRIAAGWKSRVARLIYPKYWLNYLRNTWQDLSTSAPLNYLKKKNTSMAQSNMTRMEWRKYQRHRIKYKMHLERTYKKLAVKPDLSVPYILFALHYQPEKTTSPQGGHFVHQYLAVELLARNLPTGWVLYVKEAEGQFMPGLRGEEASRHRAYYNNLVRLPGVSLVSMDTSPFELIDNAKAVATITGTMGWEAVVRGKPSLVFGYPWYLGCEGVYHVPSVNKLVAAINQIKSGTQIDPEKVNLFISIFEEKGVHAYIHPLYREAINIPYKQNVSVLAKAISEFYLFE